MSEPVSMFGPQRPEPEPEPEHEPIDWRTVAPRWLLLALVVLLAALAGALGKALTESKTERERRIEEALADTPTKYQARLTERVAILETQQVLLINAVDKLTQQFDRQAAATNKLTTQLEILTSELKRSRR